MRKEAARTGAATGTAIDRAAARVPPIDQHEMQRIRDHLFQTTKMTKPPTISARVLAMLLALHREGLPLPARRDLAVYLNCTVHGVDSALVAARKRNLITVHRPPDDPLRRRGGVVPSDVYYRPTSELLEIAAEAVAPQDNV